MNTSRQPCPRPARRWHARFVALCAVTLIGLLQPGYATRADDYDERRVRTGARLFRTLLAADMALEQKVAPDGKLRVQIYARDSSFATGIAELIAPKSDDPEAGIRGLPVSVETSAKLPVPERHLAGIFLAQIPNDAELEQIIRWGIAEHVIVYSPFEGHVERGVLGGISVEAKVRPYVNLKTLAASGIELKPFFLKVAKVHE